MNAPFGKFLSGEGKAIAELDRGEILKLVDEHKLVLVRGLRPFSQGELLSFAASGGGASALELWPGDGSEGG